MRQVIPKYQKRSICNYDIRLRSLLRTRAPFSVCFLVAAEVHVYSENVHYSGSNRTYMLYTYVPRLEQPYLLLRALP